MSLIFLKWKNYWITDSVKKALEKGKADEALDTIIYLDKLKCITMESLDDGKILSVNVKVQPLNNDEGQRIGCLIIMEDITEEKTSSIDDVPIYAKGTS